MCKLTDEKDHQNVFTCKVYTDKIPELKKCEGKHLTLHFFLSDFSLVTAACPLMSTVTVKGRNLDAHRCGINIISNHK